MIEGKRSTPYPMHLRRWLTAIVAVPVLIYVIGFGHRRLFHALLLLFSIIGLFEYFRITSPKQPLPIKIVCFILTFGLFYFFSFGRFFMILAIASLWVIVPFCFYLFFYPDQRSHALEEMGKIVLGLIIMLLSVFYPVFAQVGGITGKEVYTKKQDIITT